MKAMYHLFSLKWQLWFDFITSQMRKRDSHILFNQTIIEIASIALIIERRGRRSTMSALKELTAGGG